jgi:transposase
MTEGTSGGVLMPRAYSMDLRERVLADCDGWAGTRAVAAKFSVSESWVRRLKQRRAATGETIPRSSRNRRVGCRGRHADALRAAVVADPNRTLTELRAHLGVRVSPVTLWQALADLRIVRKKSR